MKLTAIQLNTNKPLKNTQIQLQIRGKDSCFLTVITDQNGNININNKYVGQQISSTINGTHTQWWITANEGGKLFVDKQQKETKDKIKS